MKRTAIVSALLMLALLLPVGASVASAAPVPAQLSARVSGAPTCDGRVATIVSASRIIIGTPGDDVIVATGTTGQDIRAGGGDDLICGSNGPDRITGGDGDDTVLAGRGDDRVDASAGSDSIDGGLGRDTLIGGLGSDMLIGGPGDDTITGNAGADMADGGSGIDTVIGGTGDDSLDGGAGADLIDPREGTDACAVDRTDAVLGTCAVDTTAPIIGDLSVPTPVVAGRTMTIRWRVVDPGGVGITTMRIGGSSGWVTRWCGFVTSGDLVEGSVFDGVYSASCAVPADAVNGSYTVFLTASDNFGNTDRSGFGAQIDLTVVGGSKDSAAPVVTVLWANQLDSGDVLVQFRATDESGIGALSLFLALDGYSFASVEKGTYFNYGDTNLGSGDAFDGVYLQKMARLPFTPHGEYSIWVSVIDRVGNHAFFRTPVSVTI